MSVSLKLRQALVIDDDEVAGDRLLDQSITLGTGQAFTVRARIIADNYGEDVLWTTGEGGLDTFTHGFIISDQDLWVQLRNDDTGVVEYVRMFVPANVMTFIPAKVAGGTTDAFDGSVLVDNTDYADVDRIEVMRDVADAVGDAIVNLFLFV